VELQADVQVTHSDSIRRKPRLSSEATA
jgi:hypothetical protein